MCLTILGSIEKGITEFIEHQKFLRLGSDSAARPQLVLELTSRKQSTELALHKIR